MDHDQSQTDVVNRLPRTPTIDAVRSLFELQAKIVESASKPVEVIIGGGIAAHYWTRARTTLDVDAEFLQKVLVATHRVTYESAPGQKQSLFFDRNYNTTLGTLHEGYRDRAVRVRDFEPSDRLLVYVMAPVDLAVSKLGRFQGNDQRDIAEMAKLGLIDAVQFEQLATEAIDYFVGDKGPLPMNRDRALQIVRELTPTPSERWS